MIDKFVHRNAYKFINKTLMTNAQAVCLRMCLKIYCRDAYLLCTRIITNVEIDQN